MPDSISRPWIVMTQGTVLTTLETVSCLTPAARATSFMHRVAVTG